MNLRLLGERLLNYPGRRSVNQNLKNWRKQFLASLPKAEPAVTYIERQDRWDRWAGLDAARYPEAASRAPGDRPTRLAELRLYEGRFTLDPLSTNLFSDGRMVWGSYDGIGREREPSIWSYLRGPSVELDEFVSLRGAFENNYFHFLYDFMPKLMMVERHVPKGTPLVVGDTLLRQPYFRDAERMGIFAGHRFVAQNRSTRIGGKKVWVACPSEPRRDEFLALAERFGATPPEPGRAGRRLYVARGPKANNKRRLVNEKALFSALQTFGFEFFDPQEHDLKTQIKTFSETDTIVAPHGAALTNLIWRMGRPLAVWELVNPSMHTLDMMHISVQLGYDHRLIENRGDGGQPVRASAYADIDRVVSALDETLGRSDRKVA